MSFIPPCQCLSTAPPPRISAMQQHKVRWQYILFTVLQAILFTVLQAISKPMFLYLRSPYFIQCEVFTFIKDHGPRRCFIQTTFLLKTEIEQIKNVKFRCVSFANMVHKKAASCFSMFDLLLFKRLSLSGLQMSKYQPSRPNLQHCSNHFFHKLGCQRGPSKFPYHCM